MQPRFKILAFAALVAVASGQAGQQGCPVQITGPAPAPIPVAPEGSILVSIENHSGLTSVVEAVFSAGGQEVRRTTRVLTASGIESTAKVIRTTAEEVRIDARIASPVTGTIETKYLGGFVLASGTYLKGKDFEDRGGIDFIIPPPPVDCNSNGSPDSTDISSNTSRDCDRNTVPDECESGVPTLVQCAGEIVVAADENGAGVVPDLTHLLVAVDSCTPANQLQSSQDVAAGTPLSLGTPVSIMLTVADADANTVQCSSSVTMIDATPPLLVCPGELVLTVNSRLHAKVPDMATIVQVSDNCQTVSPLTFSQSIPAGALLPGGMVTTMSMTATDGSGNTSECACTVRVVVPIGPES
ncbi:MAG: HYR domain-containing protein [Planctomycetes bacterium]|nr:HYR domain-containing protein [Planctomycetota bacterium]